MIIFPYRYDERTAPLREPFRLYEKMLLRAKEHFLLDNQSMGRVQPNVSSILPHWMPVRKSYSF